MASLRNTPPPPPPPKKKKQQHDFTKIITYFTLIGNELFIFIAIKVK